jgi:hypothetical protein
LQNLKNQFVPSMGSVPVVAECTGCLIGFLCPVLIDVGCLEDLKFERAPKKTFPFVAASISSATERNSWRNFQRLYRGLADRWIAFDHSGEAPIILEESQ